MKIRDYTGKLSLAELKEIIADHEQFERDGFIGDCFLRRLTRRVLDDLEIYSPSIILWMNLIANDCYRVIAEESLSRGLIEPGFFNKN